MSSLSASTVFVPLSHSLSADAPGYAHSSSSTLGPACWKCKGAGSLKTKRCSVCPDETPGYLPVKKLKTLSPPSPTSLALLAKYDFLIEVPPPRALPPAHYAALATREGRSNIATPTPSSLHATLHSLNYTPPPTTTPQTYTYSNFLGTSRILQETKGGHRYTTDDIMTAYIAFPHLVPDVAWSHCDLGCGNSSVLLQLAYLTRTPPTPYSPPPPNPLPQTGVEARLQAYTLSRASVLLSYGATSPITHLRGDFRTLTQPDSPLFKSLPTPKYSIVTGTPPYFEIKVTESTVGVDSVIVEGGMPSNVQSAPARCEFRGGVEAYALSAAAIMEPDGVFVVCENSINEKRVFEGAVTAGMRVEEVVEVVGRVGKPPLFGVYTLRLGLSEEEAKRTRIIVRDDAGEWTQEYKVIMGHMGLDCS